MTRLLAAATAIVAVFLCPPAMAAQCAPASMLLPALERSGEKPIWQGIAGGHLVLLFAHPKTSEWTFVGISPEKLACIVAHGNDAELVAGRKVSVKPKERYDP